MEIPNQQERKLKRGLHDLSPLFQAPSAETQPAGSAKFDVQFLTVCVPDHEGDAFLANAYVASEMVRRTRLFASLVSVAPGFDVASAKPSDSLPSFEVLDSRISRVRLSHQELWKLTQGRSLTSQKFSSKPSVSPSSFLTFLEFEPSQFRSLARIALLLDRAILFLSPKIESLREAYRTMKIFWNLNREIEFFLLFRDKVLIQKQEEFLFERFSLITSRFLGVSTGWLGNLPFPEKSATSEMALHEWDSGFNWEALLTDEGLRRPLSPEKTRFWEGLKELFK